MQGLGECQAVCCGKPVEALESKSVDDSHPISISEIENDFYIEFSHKMTKVHFIGFAA